MEAPLPSGWIKMTLPVCSDVSVDEQLVNTIIRLTTAMAIDAKRLIFRVM
jgi:hypothetical protein